MVKLVETFLDLVAKLIEKYRTVQSGCHADSSPIVMLTNNKVAAWCSG